MDKEKFTFKIKEVFSKKSKGAVSQKQKQDAHVTEEVLTNFRPILDGLRKKIEENGVVIYDEAERSKHNKNNLFHARRGVVLISNNGNMFLASLSLDSHENIVQIQNYGIKKGAGQTVTFTNDTIDNSLNEVTPKKVRRLMRKVHGADVNIEATRKLR
jgi:hypothetical protein